MRDTRTIAFAVTCLSVALALPACTGKAKPPAAAYPVKIETVDGLRTVLNPAFPKNGVVRYALREEIVAGGEGGDAGSVLNRPMFLDVDAQGNIYVLDWGDVDLKVFAPDGRLLRKFGKKGQGPGEFDTPVYFDLAADGRIFLLSMRQNLVITLDPEGRYLSSFRVDGPSKNLAADSRGRLYYAEILPPQSTVGEEFVLIQNRQALIRADVLGKDKARLGEYPDRPAMRKVRNVGGAMSSVGLSTPDAYTTSWLVGPEDRIYIGHNKDYRLDVYDADGKLLFRFGREFAPIRHPQYKPGQAFPEFYPAFSDRDRFLDDKDNLWLGQYVAEGAKDRVYDVFSPDGIYLEQVLVPESLRLVRGDLAYSIVKTEDEFLVVKRFKIVQEGQPQK